jgi:oligopeptide transport system ATP-binding protein
MRDVQMIFQDPFSSLNPRMTVKDLIAEGLNIHRIGTKKDRIDRVYELLDLVGLNKQFITRYAHEFSGGQRQRLVIARALAVDPKFIICDEPISALDVSIQAQIVNLLQELQDKLGLSYLFIAHDLSMVKHVSDRIAVMYLGKIVEMAKKKELFDNPLHPYTQALLASIPIPDPVLERAKEGFTIQGEIPSPFILGEGCAFKTRCPHHHKACDKLNDSHKSVGNNHFVMCTLFDH